MVNDNKFGLFSGYEKKSKRYNTKRRAEIKAKEKNKLSVYNKLKEILANPSGVDPDDLEVYRKRFNSLQDFSNRKETDLSQNFIPFRVDFRTVVFVREKNCFKPKWLAKFGRKHIEKRISDFKEVLHKKPDGATYWNPFFV